MGHSPRSVDERSRHEDVELGDLRRAIPPHCLRPATWRSWLSLLRVLAVIGLCIAALRVLPLEWGPALVWQGPLLLAIWVVHGLSLLGLFVIGHDCGHRSFSRRRWVNDVIGHLCMAPLVNGLRGWQLTHDHHHRHTQERGHEIDWSARLLTRDERARLGSAVPLVTRLGYALPFGVFFWIAANVVRRAARA